MVLTFVSHLSASSDVAATLREERGSVLPVLGSTLTIAAVMGSISIALAALTPRRALASAVIFGTMILTGAVSGIIQQTGSRASGYATLLSPVRVLFGVITWLFDVPTPARPGRPVTPNPVSGAGYAGMAVALTVLAALAIFARYSRVRA